MKRILFPLAFLMVVSLTAQELDSGLVMYYPLDGDFVDVISGEAATTGGSITFEPGKVDTAARYFSQDDYILTEENALRVGPSVDSGTAGTFALFVNHRAGPLETDRQNYLAQKNLCGPDNRNRGRVVLYRQNPENATDPDSLITFFGGRPNRTGYKLDAADTWIHLALTVEPDSNEWAFYVDGVEVKRDTFAGNSLPENSCGAYVVGHHLTFTNQAQTFDGLMDELRFYNRVLTDEEIGLLANGVTSSTRETVVDESFVLLSPNPVARNQPLNISVDRSVFKTGADVRVSVFDFNGRKVREQQYDSVAELLEFNHRLSPGVYTVTLTDGERLAAKKLVVW